MNKRGKKLSLAFYWHMHQPVYELEGTYLMPWVRLHAVKDYLDMALVLEKFPKLKLNFNIVPALLDSIIDYAENNYQDIHSDLTVSDCEKITEDEKTFILNNFFSAKFETMIYKSETYKNLYQKRFSKDGSETNNFSAQEISDLMALFNLVWIDNVHYEKYPRLSKLWEKQSNYTQQDRIEIIEIQKQIIKEIIPTYRKYINEGRLELTTSPYYHPILPILTDMKNSVKNVKTTEGLPKTLGMSDDAKFQIQTALERIEEVFGVRPKGMWPPELCLCQKTLNFLAQEGIQWTISDEGVLSKSINYEFIRDFKGNLNDPYHLLKTYNYQTKESEIKIIFRDRSIPNLINFSYAGINSDLAAGDLYEKIKMIQNKLLVSPDNKHLLTIATDCENCWENYQNDGRDFLENLYRMIEEDETLETVLISDYIKNDNAIKKLKKFSSGSWINNTFQYWIGDVEKNKAWGYLKQVKDDCFIKEQGANPQDLLKAKRELLISQGSDWYWWYGEPNNSGQDFVFDYMFRERLKNVYNILGKNYPEFLDKTLIETVEIPFKHPKCNISPRMDGLITSNSDWECAGSLNPIDGPVFRENKNIDKILFGCDSQNIYFRFHINKGMEESGFIDRINQFYIYTRNTAKTDKSAYIRLISKTDNPYPLLVEKFEHELTLTLVKETLYPIRLASVLHPNIWTLGNPEGIKIVFGDVIDLCIPFDKLGIEYGETIEFFMANTDSGVRNTYISQEILLSMTRN